MTDHSISATGYTEYFNTGETSIRYFDPGPGGKRAATRGTAETNVITIAGNKLTGTLIWGKKQDFTVTQIRSRK